MYITSTLDDVIVLTVCHLNMTHNTLFSMVLTLLTYVFWQRQLDAELSKKIDTVKLS